MSIVGFGSTLTLTIKLKLKPYLSLSLYEEDGGFFQFSTRSAQRSKSRQWGRFKVHIWAYNFKSGRTSTSQKNKRPAFVRLISGQEFYFLLFLELAEHSFMLNNVQYSVIYVNIL